MMKRVLSFLLAALLLMSLTVNALADAPVADPEEDGLFAESEEMTQGELYRALQSFYAGTDFVSLVNAALKKELSAKTFSAETVVDESSFRFVLDGAVPVTDSEEPLTLKFGAHTVSVQFSYHSDISYKKTLISTTKKVSRDGSFDGAEKKFTFSYRLKTTLALAKNSVYVTFGDENAEETVLAQLLPVLTASDGTVIQGAALTFSQKLTGLKVGEYTVTVSYGGLADNGSGVGYQPAKSQFKLTVRKAATHVDVESTTVGYDGSEHAVKVTVTPEAVPYTAITVGLQGNAEGFASFYMSEGNALYKALVFARDAGDTVQWLARLVGIDLSEFMIGSEGVSLSQLRTLLSNITKLNDLLIKSGIALEDSEITGILTALEAIEKVMPDLNVTFYIKNMPKNEGLYLTYAVASDDNHNTAIGFGYTTIAPSFKGSIKWSESMADNKFTFTMDNVSNFDFSAYMAEETEDGREKKISKDVTYQITGLTSGGKIFSSDSLDELPTLPGLYTETAYSLYNYVAAESRTFTIAKDEAFVKFVDESGNYVDTLNVTTTYSGVDKPITAVVVDKDGNEIEGAKVTYSYSGKTNSKKIYLSTKAPKDSGTYTVNASFAGNDLFQSASNQSATITINKAKASITFDDINVRIFKTVDVSGTGYTYTGMSEAEAAAIAATLKPSLKIYLIIGTYHTSVTIPDEIAAQYDVTVNGGTIRAKLK